MKNILYTLFVSIALTVTGLAQLPDFGAQTKGASAETREELDLKKNVGLEVTGVFADSDAERLGLKVGDVVTHLDERPVKSTTGLANLLGALYEVGDDVSLTWNRDGKTMSGDVTLEGTATKKAFAKRYEKASGAGAQAAPGDIGALLGGLLGGDVEDLDGLDFGAVQGGAFMLGPDGKLVPLDEDADFADQFGEELDEDELKEMQKALGGLDFAELLKGGGGVVQLSTQIQSGDSSIEHEVKKNGKHKFTIRDKDGEVEFKGAITEDELDRIPEEHRETAKMLMTSGGIGGLLQGAGGFQFDGFGEDEEAGKNLGELLEGLDGE